jgi:hypothetical protein
VTGKIVGFEPRKPSDDENDRAREAAKACFPAHDPFLPAFDYLDNITNRIEVAVQQINAGPAISLDDQLRRAVIQGISGHSRTALQAMGWRNLLLATLAAVGLITAAFAGGYWVRGPAPVLVGVHAGAERCEDRPDKSRLCWIPVWERLPPATGPAH